MYSWVFTVGDFNPETAECLPDLQIANNNDNQDAINISVYRALSITSNGSIPGYGNTRYTAKEDVQFNGGFEVNTGGAFEASIENCNDE